MQRVELDAPILDVPALQAWLATRPPSETRIPTLTHGGLAALGLLLATLAARSLRRRPLQG